MDITVKEIIGMGIGASVVGTMWSHLAALPKFVWNKARQNLITTLEVPIVDEYEMKNLVRWIEYWMSIHAKKNNRYLKANWRYDNLEEEYTALLAPDVVYNPGWFRFKGKVLLINAWRREASNSGKVFFDYTLTFFTREADIAKDFIKEAKALYTKAFEDRVHCKIFQGGNWTEAKVINPRSFDSVILPGDELRKLVNDVDTFIERKELYERLNLNHKRGYLFEGVPGSGKSTLANAIAYYLKWNLYSFSKASGVNATMLNDAFVEIKPKSVVLLEDVDGYGIQRGESGQNNDQTNNSIDWLNWLDGINTPPDVIFILTTNYADQLDCALIRDGRIDYRVHFDYALPEQIEKAFLRFNPTKSCTEAKEFAESFCDKQVVMADIQNQLLKGLENHE